MLSSSVNKNGRHGALVLVLGLSVRMEKSKEGDAWKVENTLRLTKIPHIHSSNVPFKFQPLNAVPRV